MTKQPRRYVEHPKIRSMRVRSWFHAVSQTSGLTVGELEREFREEGSARAPRSCIWNKYKRGEVVPRSRYQGDRRPKLVERVEARYPGTEKWLFSPLWLLVDVASMEMSDLRTIYEGLPPRIRDYFILSPSLVTKVFWRCPLHSEQLLVQFLSFHTVEDLVASVALIREAEIIQSRPLLQYWILAVQELMRQVDWGGLRNSTIPRELSEYLQRRWAIS